MPKTALNDGFQCWSLDDYFVRAHTKKHAFMQCTTEHTSDLHVKTA